MKSNKLYTIIATLIFGVSIAHANLSQITGEVSMGIAKYAQVTNLGDFSLTIETDQTDGAANAYYSGTGTYNLESNTGVLVTLTNANVSNGSDTVSTLFNVNLGTDSVTSITENSLTFNAPAKHDEQHTIGARAKLGGISDQAAGNYTADITLTVTAL